MSDPLTLAGRAVLLSHHVDGLELSCAVERLPPRLAGRPDELECALDLWQRRSRSTTPAWPVATSWSWDGEPVQLHPRGMRPGKRYCLEASDWMVFVSTDNAPGPRFVAQLRSDYLLQAGPLPAYSAVRTWVEESLVSLLDLVPDSKPRWGIARLDLAADLAGVKLGPSDLARFTTRARARRAFDAGSNVASTTLYSGRSLTGYTFGKRGSPCHARIYDKSKEASASSPIRDVWKLAGYDAQTHGEQVWRVEYEVRSSLLRELAGADCHLPTDPGELLARHLDELWAYLTAVWLVLRAPRASRIERSPAAEWWAALSAVTGLNGEQFGPARPLARRPREQLDATIPLRQAVGLLVSAAAANGGDSSLERALEAFGSYARCAVGERAFARRVRERARRHRAARASPCGAQPQP
jgi:hypothetical protein